MTPSLRYARGQHVSVGIEAVKGAAAAADATCAAVLKLAINGKPPPYSVAPVAAFAVVWSDELEPGAGPGWILTLTAEETAALEPEIYVTDARITLASGFVQQTDPIRIDLRERVT